MRLLPGLSILWLYGGSRTNRSSAFLVPRKPPHPQYSFSLSFPTIRTRTTQLCSTKKSNNNDKTKKQEIIEKIGETMRKETERESSNRLLDQINPFKAGQSLRRTIDTVMSNPKKNEIYQDLETGAVDEKYIPEVLVIGATQGELGPMVVQQLLLSNRARVRVLVPDLYTDTLNKLGTSVTYCQGNLQNQDSMEYAVTDVDKIIFIEQQFVLEDLQNLIRAYQDVRHADYGLSQAAKRSLFRFQSRPEDFYLFDVEGGGGGSSSSSSTVSGNTDEGGYEGAKEDGGGSSTGVQWIRNQFEHGVFMGKQQTRATIMSSRLRSREEPDCGIDFAPNFGGFVVRACGDGHTYQCVIRNAQYYEKGIEYVYDFTTSTKSESKNESKNKFTTVRVPFDRFVPKRDGKVVEAPPFYGADVRNIGFRFDSDNDSGKKESDFYLALCYIKLFRSQPEPEFVYLSDARIPSVLNEAGTMTLDDSMDDLDRITRFHQGEQLLKNSGLSYCIPRIAGLSGSVGDVYDLDLSPGPSNSLISPSEVAQICVGAVLDPQALNKVFSVIQSKNTNELSMKFAKIS